MHSTPDPKGQAYFFKLFPESLVTDPSPAGGAGRRIEPAASGGDAVGPNPAGGHPFLHLIGLALGTFGQGFIRKRYQFFKLMIALLANEFIHRHICSLLACLANDDYL
jgi:hypothetical protein